MKRINVFEMYELGKAMAIVRRAQAEGVMTPQLRNQLSGASIRLKFAVRSYGDLLGGNKKALETLSDAIETLISVPYDKPINIIQWITFTGALEGLEHTISYELSRQHTYYIPQVLGYDSDVLISNGILNLTESAREYLSALATANFNEGCRCLALRQSTAAGFLLLRSVEDVLHDYYDAVSNGAARPKRRNMGDYINALESVPNVDVKMLAVLRDVKNLRRNPLMHPEHLLDLDDAVAIFDVAKSSIAAMARLAKACDLTPVP